MKKLQTKAELRAQLEREMRRFLDGGGAIRRVDPGVSAREPGDPPVRHGGDMFLQPRASRTPIPEVIAALEARRKPEKKPAAPRTARRRPRVIYDDFGEPLRRIWPDD
jgi:hypothetical protein